MPLIRFLFHSWILSNMENPVMRLAHCRSATALLPTLILAFLAGCSSPTPPSVSAGSAASDTAATERSTSAVLNRDGRGQLLIPFGSNEPTEAQRRAERQRQSTTQGLVPEGRAYLGSIPCETSACSVQRVTLTLLPDGRWRRISLPLSPAGTARTDSGCWTAEAGTPPYIHLHPTGHGQSTASDQSALATLRMQTPAVLSVQTLGAQKLAHRYTMNIQADTESIRALQNDTSFFCPTQG